MTYNFTEEEREILEQAEKILDTLENLAMEKFNAGTDYFADMSEKCEIPSCIIAEILSNEDLEIEMSEYA